MSVPEVRAALPIASVTVYPQSALVVRRGRLPLAAGESNISLAGLPGELTADTVRVEVESNAGLVILDVTAAERFLDLAGGREFEKHKAKYDTLLVERKKYQGHLANCLSELMLFLEKKGLPGRDQCLPVNVASWKEFFGFLRERLGENRALNRENLFALLELEKKIAAAAANLARRQTAPPQEHEIALRVEAPQEAEYEISLAYLQEGVFWYPVYAVSGDPDQKSLAITLSAVVGQATGEDWKDIELLLSTAVPRFSCSIPELASKRLREQDAKIELRKAAPAGIVSRMEENMKDSLVPEEMLKERSAPAILGRMRGPKKKEKDKVKMMAPASAVATVGKKLGVDHAFGAADFRAPGAPQHKVETFQPVTAPEGSELLHATVSRYEQELGAAWGGSIPDRYTQELFRLAGGPASAIEPVPPEPESTLPGWMSRGVSPLESLGGYDYRFPVTGRRDIPSSPVPHKVPVARKQLSVEFVYVTVPAVKEAAFLKALFANDADNPLPAGPAQIFAGDNLIGSLFFATLGPGEKGELSLGAERDIKVLRRENNRRRRRGVVAKEVITDFSIEIELISFKNEKIDIAVYDRLPVSRQSKDIAVSDFRASPAARRTERNILVWRVSLPPREKAIVGFQYSIRHPENYRVVMEEDPVPFQSGQEE
jgi:hypothetical protein